MAKKSSFLLAVLFIANPFVLLFYQNCSKAPHPRTVDTKVIQPTKAPASETH